MRQETNSNREKLIPIEQSSLEKGIQYLKDTKISNRYTIQQQIEKAINIALADQKAKIQEWLEQKFMCAEDLDIILKEFEELFK